MPLYEYRCEDCGETIEIIQKFADPPLSRCDVCGGALERLLSAPAIQFRGSGWYVTDYSGKNGAGSGQESEGTKKESKPAKKESDSSDSKTDKSDVS